MVLSSLWYHNSNFCKIILTIIKIDKTGIHKNRSNSMEINDYTQVFKSKRWHRLNNSGKEGGRGFASIKDYVDDSIQGLEKITKTSKRIKIASNIISNLWPNRKATKTGKQKWKEKQLSGYFN